MSVHDINARGQKKLFGASVVAFMTILLSRLMNPTLSRYGGRKGPKEVLCKCLSHCAAINPATGRREGGQWLSRGTRDNHTREDRIREISVRLRRHMPDTRISGHPQSASAAPDPAVNTLLAMEQELEWLSGLPIVTSFPLIFLNNPVGDFQWPSPSEMLEPNSGPHPLRHARVNAPFLFTENHLSELIKRLQREEESQHTEELLLRLWDELFHLQNTKELQWAQQRDLVRQQAGDGSGHPFVSTGKLPFSTRK